MLLLLNQESRWLECCGNKVISECEVCTCDMWAFSQKRLSADGFSPRSSSHLRAFYTPSNALQIFALTTLVLYA